MITKNLLDINLVGRSFYEDSILLFLIAWVKKIKNQIHIFDVQTIFYQMISIINSKIYYKIFFMQKD